MDKLPVDFVRSNVVSFYIPKFFECEEDLIDLVVITTDGKLLELRHKTILTACKLCTEIKGCATLNVCYTYGPKIKYYIVLVNSTLYAIKKSGKILQCLHLLDDVKQFSIEDKENLGTPQIIALNINEALPPSVLNLLSHFAQSDLGSKLIAPAVLKLYSHVNNMHMQIRKVQQLLSEKKTLVSRMTADYMFITDKEVALDDYEELAVVFGEKSDEHSKTRSYPFSLGKLWIRLCYDFWVIGVYLANLQNRKIFSLELLVMDQSICVDKTIFFTNCEKMEPFDCTTDFKKIDFVPSHGHGYVVGVLREPVFRCPTIGITCNLSFNFDKQKSEQLHIGSVEVEHTDILNSRYAAFHLDNTVSDLLTIFATSFTCDLQITEFNEEVWSKIASILSNLNFQKINEKYYLCDYKTMISFRGIIIKIINQEDSCILSFYGRNIQELCLYLQPFKQLPTDIIKVKKTCVTIRTIFTSLLNEIKYFNDNIKPQNLVNNTNLCSLNTTIVPLDIPEVNKLINLEENTEHFFHSFKQ